MNFKNELRLVIDEFKEKYPVEHLKDKDVYAQWIAQTYFFVCHSVPLLGFALPHLKEAGLRHHFEHHIGQEERHEMLALKDLERLGFKVSDFEETAATQAFYQSQYYRIQFEGATSFLGYILFLEAMAIEWARDMYEVVKDQHKNSVVFLKVHVEEDVNHVESALNLIATLSPAEQEAIKKNLWYSAQMYAQIVENSLEKRAKKLAA